MLVNRYKLTLRSLKFLSAVDFPAQEPATCVLTKRKDAAPDVKASYRVTKMDESLGLVIGMSIITSIDGVPYTDLQGDEVQEQDLLKTVVAFMESGAPTDTQHNRETDGRVVLSWVFDAETNKAMDVTARKHGWATGLKVSPETFAKFKSGEYTGFSIDGTGERATVEKGRVLKASLYTDVVDGHQHQICIWDNGEMYVQSATSEGAEMSHSHGIVRGADGAIEILLDSGHTHSIAADQANVVIVEPETIVVVQARAPQSDNKIAVRVDGAALARASKSTQPKASTKMDSQVKENAVDKDQIIADLTKRAERAERIVKMSGAHKTHFDTLTGDDAEAFLAKSNAEREAIVKAVRDADAALSEVVYTSSSTGETFSKRDDARLVSMAKRADEQAAQIEKADVRKQAAEILGGMPGDDETHDFIIAQCRGNEKAIATLKGMKETSRIGKKAPGGGGDNPIPDGPQAELDALVAKYAADNKVDIAKARLAVVKTAEGRALYNQIEDLRKSKALGAR